MTVDYKGIGARIKEHRRQKSITQAKLAEMTDMADAFISRIETGRKKASLGTLIKIANSLDASLDVLVFGDEIAK